MGGPSCAKELCQPRRRRPHRHGEHRAERRRNIESIPGHAQRALNLARSEEARHCGRGGVREKDHDADGRLHHGGAGGRPRQLGDAEVTDDRRIGEKEQWLGDQRAERGDGKGEDLPPNGTDQRERPFQMFTDASTA